MPTGTGQSLSSHNGLQDQDTAVRAVQSEIKEALKTVLPFGAVDPAPGSQAWAWGRAGAYPLTQSLTPLAKSDPLKGYLRGRVLGVVSRTRGARFANQRN